MEGFSRQKTDGGRARDLAIIINGIRNCIYESEGQVRGTATLAHLIG